MSRFFPALAPAAPLQLGPGLGKHPLREPSVQDGDLPMPELRSVTEALIARARATPERPAYLMLDMEDRPIVLTYAELLSAARRAAASLAARGVGRGHAVVLCMDTCPDLLALFYGCILLGAAPALIEPPLGLSRESEWPARLGRMLERSGAPLLVVEESLRDAARAAVASGGRAEAVSVDALEVGPEAPLGELPGPDEIAFLQFTSGTTSVPKGVQISHAALVANARALSGSGAWRSSDCMLGWLPLYHDMGLVGCVLTPMIAGCPGGLFSPLSFLFRPARWLWAMHYFRGTLSPAPNFAFQLCLKRVADEEIQGLDLGAWRIAYNGAEMVLPDTVARFFQRYAAHGFRASSMRPCYGMAEVTLIVSATPLDRPPRVDTISRAELAEDGRVTRAAAGPQAMQVVGVGRPVPGIELRIAGPDGAALPERRQGEIWVRGPSLFSGYVGLEEPVLEAGGWLRTGDLGYLADGELFITGRIKDLVVKRGRNYAPYDLEVAAGRVPGVRGGCVAALGLPDAESGTESLVIVFETSVEEEARWGLLAQAVEKAVYDAVGIRPDRVVPTPPRSLPKTSSGKLMRPSVAAMVQSGALRPQVSPCAPPPG
jgi:fatty-acyl-CoA synthase